MKVYNPNYVNSARAIYMALDHSLGKTIDHDLIANRARLLGIMSESWGIPIKDIVTSPRYEGEKNMSENFLRGCPSRLDGGEGSGL